jgi:hypothetical protein
VQVPALRASPSSIADPPPNLSSTNPYGPLPRSLTANLLATSLSPIAELPQNDKLAHATDMTDQLAQSGEEQLRTDEPPHSLEATKQDSNIPSDGTGHETTASSTLTANAGKEHVSGSSPRKDATGGDSDDVDNDADDDADDDEEDDEDNEEEDDDDDEEDEEEDEPQLKYARLTQHLIPVYRNGDATSAFLVAGDKMVGFDITNSCNVC